MTDEPFFSKKFHYTFGPHEPTIRVASGQSLSIVCPDSDNFLEDGTTLAPSQRQASAGTELFEGNPVAGPVYVEGLQPGDCLAVSIEKIELNRNWGRTLLAPAHGLLSSDQLSPPDEEGRSDAVPRHMYQWEIDPAQGVARLNNSLGEEKLEVPLRPMVGSIGVCPSWGQEISTLMAGSFGGNLDLPIIEPGAIVLLPVFHSGGLLMLGDLHAAQGHGEIVGGGIETSGRVDATFHALSESSIPAPRIVGKTSLYTASVGADLRTAVRQAYAYLVDWLVELFGLNRWDAYQLVSQVGVVQIGGLANESFCTVAAGISMQCLPARCQDLIHAWREGLV